MRFINSVSKLTLQNACLYTSRIDPLKTNFASQTYQNTLNKTMLPKSKMLKLNITGVVGVIIGQKHQNQMKTWYITANKLLIDPHGSGILHWHQWIFLRSVTLSGPFWVPPVRWRYRSSANTRRYVEWLHGKCEVSQEYTNVHVCNFASLAEQVYIIILRIGMCVTVQTAFAFFCWAVYATHSSRRDDGACFEYHTPMSTTNINAFEQCFQNPCRSCRSLHIPLDSRKCDIPALDFSYSSQPPSFLTMLTMATTTSWAVCGKSKSTHVWGCVLPYHLSSI